MGNHDSKLCQSATFFLLPPFLSSSGRNQVCIRKKPGKRGKCCKAQNKKSSIKLKAKAQGLHTWPGHTLCIQSTLRQFRTGKVIYNMGRLLKSGPLVMYWALGFERSSAEFCCGSSGISAAEARSRGDVRNSSCKFSPLLPAFATLPKKVKELGTSHHYISSP